MKAFLKNWLPGIIVVGLIAYFGWRWGAPLYRIYFAHPAEGVSVRTDVVKKGSFVIGFHAMGDVDADRSTPVLTQSDGRIEWITQNGIVVKAGDPICTLDTAPMKIKLNTARLAYESAVSNVSRTEEAIRMYKLSKQNDVAKAEADYAFSEEQLALVKDQLKKKRDLAKDKLIAAQEIIQADMDVQSKEKDLKKAKMDLDLLKKQVESDIKLKSRDVEEANLAVKNRKNDLDDIQNRIDKSKMVAPTAGLVVLNVGDHTDGRRVLINGDTLGKGQPVCVLPDLSRMIVTLKLGEIETTRVKVGQPVLIHLDSVRNKVFHGTVRSLNTVAKMDNVFSGGSGRMVCGVLIMVKESDPNFLKPGMSADVEFICKEVKDTLYVPIESVTRKGGKSIVYIRKDGSFSPVTVKTGEFNDRFISVKEGLAQGQTVALGAVESK